MKLKLIKQVVSELAEQLTGAKISKIYQPVPDVVIFKLWNGQISQRLLLSAEPGRSRFHLTTQNWLNPHQPPRFCQLLRSRISRINSITVVNDDRIVQFNCSGSKGECRLLVELTGTRSNFILVDEHGEIVDSLRRISGETSERQILPGQKYLYPEKHGYSADEKGELIETPEAGLTWNQSVEKLYTDNEHTQNKHDIFRQLQQTVNRQIKKLKKRLLVIDKDLQKQQGAAGKRVKGELLLANLHLLKRGMDEIRLENYYLQPIESVTIPLDPRLTPQQNVEKYFKLYKKSKRGEEHSRRRRQETETELQWLEQLEYQLKDTVKNSDIEEIAEELRDAGLLKDKNRLHVKRTLAPSKPHETISPSGFKIIWGRNNRQNDEISTRFLKNGDYWFHAHRIPGAHVVMKVSNTNMTPTEDDINYAAAIAAGYSKSRNDHKVEVIRAEAKSVRKAKGARPGLVNILQYKTVTVSPVRLA